MYAYDISLLCPTLSGVQKCYRYVKIMPLITKLHLMLLNISYLDKDHSDLLSLTMKYVIPYVSKCLHLGTTIYTTLYRDNVIDVVYELYKHTNYLLSDFFFTESCTVCNLFNSFCMNLYSCQMWRFNNKIHSKAIHVAWRKCIRRIWKLNSKLIMTYYIILLTVYL